MAGASTTVARSLDVADIGRQRQNGTINIDTLLVEAQQTSHDEGVAYVMQAVARIIATRLPAQLLTERLQGVADARRIGSTAVVAQEESVTRGSWLEPISLPRIGMQRVSNARVQWNEALLVKLGFTNMKGAAMKVDVSRGQRECFRNTKSRRSE